MQPLEEKDSSPLEDTEITRLIKVSRELGYKKQDKIPERNLVDFKPTSITQIATSSDNKPIDGTESTDLVETVQSENVIENTETPDNNLSPNLPNSESVDTDPNSQSALEQKEISEPLDNTPTTTLDTSEIVPESNKIVGEDIIEEQDSEAGSAEPGIAEKELVEETPIVSPQDDATSIEKVNQEGIEIGEKTAFTDVEHKHMEALETFHTIIDNIKKKEAVDKTALTQSILRAVTRLASERAGNMIDEHPESFKNKIISFANKIEQASTCLTLNLNPVDAGLLKKNLSQSLSDKNIEIKENTELFRGDFIFQMGAVEIGDLLSEQISIAEKEKEPTIQKDNPEKDNEKVKKEVESDERGATQKTGKENMSEIDGDDKK